MAGCAGPLVKMPQPLPAAVKEYRSVVVNAAHGGSPLSTGMVITKGDLFTILADGEIGGPGTQQRYRGPVARLTYQIGAQGQQSTWWGDRKSIADESGELRLGLVRRGTGTTAPEAGAFVVDIIVWADNDPVRQADFLDELRRRDPANAQLGVVADGFLKEKELWVAERRASREVEESAKAIAALAQTAEYGTLPNK